MKVLQVHNRHMVVGGEEVMFDTIINMLIKQGHKVLVFERNNQDIKSLRDQILAFKNGIYSNPMKREISSILMSEKPDIVHIHNVYPLISPSVIVACRQWNVPVVIRCADYRIISCPVSTHLRKGTICQLCTGGREYWCVLKNCRRNIFESFAYALRNMVARKLGLFRDNVTYYLPPTEFVKQKMIEAEFPPSRIIVIPNNVPVPDSGIDAYRGEYIGYVGRISPEKGIQTLLDSAQKVGLPVRIAGDYSTMPELVKMAPANVKFLGHMNQDQLVGFYRNARLTVVPSIWFETFGLVAAEAMSHCIPVIASRIGGLPEIVEDGVTGFLFDPGNADDLAKKMGQLWGNPELCRQMGQAGRKKVMHEYSEDVYYNRLMAVYKKAIETNNERKWHKASS